jgi:hypothetical protein
MLPPRRSAAARARRWPRLTDRYRLGTTGPGTSPICVGRVGAPGIVPAAFDAGVNFFFVTADMHWPVYEHTRRGLEMLFARGGGVRDEVVVGVVSYVAQPEFTRMPFQEVIDATAGLERIDLSIVGGAYATDLTTRLISYGQHRRADVLGVRAVGATFHDRIACAHAINHDLIDIGFVRYNPAHRGAEREVFAALEPSQALLYNFKATSAFLNDEQFAALALAPDYWRPRITDYYRYALSRPEIDGLLCAFDQPSHVTELGEALAEGPLDAEKIDHLVALAELSPQKLSPSAPALRPAPRPQGAPVAPARSPSGPRAAPPAGSPASGARSSRRSKRSPGRSGGGKA